MTTEQIREVKERVEEQLLRLPGVTGVDIGNKKAGGKDTDTRAIIVYVTKKRSVPKEDEVPKEIEGVPTDVVERRFTLHAQ